MGFIENSLLPNETVIHKAKPSIMALIGPLVLLVLGCMFLYTASSDNVLLCISLFVGLLVVANMLRAFVQYITTEFAVTDRRVIAKTGGLRQNAVELQLKQIESVRVKQGILGRIFNYGSIIVTGSGGTSGKFPVISRPMELRKQVNAQIAEVV